MRRRDVMAGLGLIVAAWPSTQAAGSTRRTVAVLMPYSDTDTEVRERITAFRDELMRLGWSQKDLRIDVIWATDNLDRLRSEITQLANRNPDVIFFTGGRVTSIVQEQKVAIPTVFVGVSDPLGRGLVPSLSRPGGTISGIASPEYSVTGKLLEFLKQIVPDLRRAALVLNPANPSTLYNTKVFKTAAAAFEIEATIIEIRSERDIEPAFERFSKESFGGLVAPSDLTLLALRDTVTRIAARCKVPAIYSDRAFVTSGGLISYSADRMQMFRQGAVYVSRILRGEQVGNLPVQQPTKFELIVNLNAARSLGRAVPATVLALADEIIE